MKRLYSLLLISTVLLMACTDELLIESGSLDPTEGDADGMAFDMNVVEQADLVYEYGRTRSAAGLPPDSQVVAANAFGAHPFGDNGWGLQVHRMPLPYMGIHPRTVQSGEYSSEGAAADATRASLDAIVQSGDPLHFHDSVSIWGCVYDAPNNHHRFLFSQTLLKKIRGFRSSVHWPYVNTTEEKLVDGVLKEEICDPWEGKSMRFCVMAPAFESLENMALVTPPVYHDNGDGTATLTPPTFSYQVPSQVNEQRDLLFGSAGSDVPIDVQAGPSAMGFSERYPYEDTEEKQHLGDDDKHITLQFRHILTAVRFAQGKIPVNVTITKITLHNIKNSGVYNPSLGKWGSLDNEQNWIEENNGAATADYSITTRYNISSNGGHYDAIADSWTNEGTTYGRGGENVYIDNSQVLFLMPHTLSGDGEHTPQIQVELTEQQYKMKADGTFDLDGSGKPQYSGTTKNHTLTASLNGDIWSPGYTVTYKITIGRLEDAYYLIAEDAPEQEHDGTEITYDTNASHQPKPSFPVHSFRNFIDYSGNSEGEVTAHNFFPVNWRVAGFSRTEQDVDGTFSTTLPKLETTETDNWLTFPDAAVTSLAGVSGGITSCNFRLAAQSPTKTVNHQSTLENNGTADHLDLQTYSLDKSPIDGGWNFWGGKTANCYIVNKIGTYTFPLIYGNQVKGVEGFVDHNGTTIQHIWINDQLSDCYSEVITDISETERTVSSYYWKDSGEPPYVSGKLLWQDVKGLITSVQAHPDDVAYNQKSSSNVGRSSGMIEFRVGKATPGNAVIALVVRKRIEYQKRTATGEDSYTEWETNTTKEGTTGGYTYGDEEIVWSWHIWMTDEVYPNSQETDDKKYPTYSADKNKLVDMIGFNGETLTRIMPVNLGWKPVENVVEYYSPRFVWVLLEQIGTDNKAVVRIVQHARPPIINGTSTIYQWGRPTPLPQVLRCTGGSDNNYTWAVHPVYDIEDNDITSEFVVEPFANVQDAITHPTKMGRWGVTDDERKKDWWWDVSHNNMNFWGNVVSEDNNLKHKTVYDPCPPGFCIPQLSYFKGFSLRESITDTIHTENLNMWIEARNYHNMNQQSGQQPHGGYMYVKAHNGSIPAEDRYGTMVYIPGSGQWSNNGEGELTTILPNTSSKMDDQMKGVFWTSDWDLGTKKGHIVKLEPRKNVNSNTTRFWINSILNYGHACPIRPMGYYTNTTPWSPTTP